MKTLASHQCKRVAGIHGVRKDAGMASCRIASLILSLLGSSLACDQGASHPATVLRRAPTSTPAAQAASAAPQAQPSASPSTVPAASAKRIDQALRARWRAIADASRWRSPTVAGREAFREAMRVLLATAPECHPQAIDSVRDRLAVAGFDLKPLVDGADSSLLLVEETAAGRHGGGLYAVRCGAAHPWVIQAPHSFYDLGTGVIARKLFAEHPVRAAYWNTVHRYRGAEGEGEGAAVHPADVAHQHGSMYHAATVAAALADESLRIIQLHGMEGSTVGHPVVLSTGLPKLQPRTLAAALEPTLGKVAVFGRDTSQLGATTNVQQQVLNRSGMGRFLHVEMEKDVRDKLRRSKRARRAVVEALERRWW